MPFPEVDKDHCFECGKLGVRFGSLFPLEPVYGELGIVNTGAGSVGVRMGDRSHISPRKFNIDFNVCSPCYAEQRRRRYPEEELPVKLSYLDKLWTLQGEFQQNQELENARAVIARHEAAQEEA
jgi:hypothetical protein